MNVTTRQNYDSDILARRLANLGARARALPPSYRAGDGFNVVGMSNLGDLGAVIGTVLPGKGLVVNADLKRLGITKKIPNVIERSPAMRALDALLRVFRDDEATITTWDGVLGARGAGKADDFQWSKPSLTTVANAFSSVRSLAGNPAAMTYTSIPGGAAPDHTTTGALNWAMQLPTGGDLKYLLGMGYIAAQQLNFVSLVDLLVACGAISTTINTSQTVSSTALTRYTSGVGVNYIFEVTTAVGTTASNITATYTNSSAVGSRSSGAQAMTVSSIVGRLLPIGLGNAGALQSGDIGVQSVQSVILSAAMSTGVIALNLYKNLLWLPGVAAQVWLREAPTTQMQQFLNLPLTGGGNLGCLMLYVQPNTTSTGIKIGAFISVAG